MKSYNSIIVCCHIGVEALFILCMKKGKQWNLEILPRYPEERIKGMEITSRSRLFKCYRIVWDDKNVLKVSDIFYVFK